MLSRRRPIRDRDFASFGRRMPAVDFHSIRAESSASIPRVIEPEKAAVLRLDFERLSRQKSRKIG